MTGVKEMFSEFPKDLGFQPQPAVRWLAPRVLASSALKVVLSGVFGAYADKRELQAAFRQEVIDRFADRDQMWLDYVSDVGDGFPATYSIAWLLAQEKLDLPPGEPKRPGAVPLPTERGELLIMGGDEVYPVANSRAYEDRTKGPYAAALPEVPNGARPVLLALPGNHDWYDGLTAFIRIFAQGEDIGGWTTVQRRSYWAVRLPQRWWLLGVDIQFNTYIDAPQLQYFREAVQDMREGDAIIMCTARPSWVHTVEDPEAFASMDYFERTIIAPKKGRIRVWLSGDDHHYACFREVGGERVLITSGGGGAYLSPTHHVPETLTLPPPNAKGASKAATSGTFKRLGTYPWVPQSKRLALGVWKLPWRNYGFASVLGFLHVLLLLTLGSGIATLPGMTGGFVDAIEGATIGEVLTAAIRPFALTIIGLMLAVTVAFSHKPGTTRGRNLGFLHGVAQVALGMASLLAWGQAPVLDWAPKGWTALLVALGTFFVTGLAASWLAAGYLLLADRLANVNANEVFAAQSIEDHKSWVRMHIDEQGTLRIIPIKVPRVCREWEAGDGSPGASKLRPAPGEAPVSEMIHADAIVVPREPTSLPR
jgi:hypothetical protein